MSFCCGRGSSNSYIYKKNVCRFLGHVFYIKKYYWIKLDKGFNELSANRSNDAPLVFLFNNRKTQYLRSSDLNKRFSCKLSNYSVIPEKYRGCWLITDREIQADDNGEHFYRWVKKTHPEKKIYFLLNKNSHDWHRLNLEGFKLIAYGSFEHYKALIGCEKIISSHADDYVLNYFKDDSSKGKEFVFLQHGVIKDDLSRWLNTKNISCMVVAAKEEFNSIVSEKSEYKLSRNEVKLVGLPRHDSLLKNYYERKIIGDSILVMPTWRSYLMGPQVGTANIRLLNMHLLDSTYAKSWSSFLASDKLKDLSSYYGLKITFFPHSNIQPYLPYLNIPSYVKVLSHKDVSIQELFLKSAILITDYSSVAFDLALLKKPILYYQFDREEFFFQNKHTYKPGYFDYNKNGFGPVCLSESQLLNEIESLLKNDMKVGQVYMNRMENFFAFRDGKNSERLFDVIKDV